MKSINMRELLKAMEELEKEEGISQEYMKDALITALEAAYKENYGTEENVKIDIDKNGDIIVVAEKTIVEKVENEVKEISLEEATIQQKIFSYYKIYNKKYNNEDAEVLKNSIKKDLSIMNDVEKIKVKKRHIDPYILLNNEIKRISEIK